MVKVVLLLAPTHPLFSHSEISFVMIWIFTFPPCQWACRNNHMCILNSTDINIQITPHMYTLQWWYIWIKDDSQATQSPRMLWCMCSLWLFSLTPFLTFFNSAASQSWNLWECHVLQQQQQQRRQQRNGLQWVRTHSRTQPSAGGEAVSERGWKASYCKLLFTLLCTVTR